MIKLLADRQRRERNSELSGIVVEREVGGYYKNGDPMWCYAGEDSDCIDKGLMAQRIRKKTVSSGTHLCNMPFVA